MILSNCALFNEGCLPCGPHSDSILLSLDCGLVKEQLDMKVGLLLHSNKPVADRSGWDPRPT